MGKVDVYKQVTDTIVEALKQGTVPWKKPWRSHVPTNLVSKKPYRGINLLILGLAPYKSHFWVTFKQAKDLGGTVRKGEKSTIVVLWKRIRIEETDKQTGKKTKKVIPLLRYYRVFNVEQCDGLDDRIPVDEANDFDPIEAAEAIVAGMPKPPEVKEGGARAYYSPPDDLIGIPLPEDFHTAEGFYATKFHEMMHATGHKDRLARDGVVKANFFGSEDYSKEELVAEIGASMLAAKAGIEPATIDNAAAYCQSWLKRLQEDEKLIVQAAGQAQRGADYVLGITFEDKE